GLPARHPEEHTMTDPKRRDPVPADYDPAHAAAVIETLDQHGARLDGVHRVLRAHEGNLNTVRERLDAADERDTARSPFLAQHREELDAQSGELTRHTKTIGGL